MRCITKVTMYIFGIFSSSFALFTFNATNVPGSHRVNFIIIAVVPVEHWLLITENLLQSTQWCNEQQSQKLHSTSEDSGSFPGQANQFWKKSKVQSMIK